MQEKKTANSEINTQENPIQRCSHMSDITDHI